MKEVFSFDFILGIAFGKNMNIPSNENESTNHMFANQYLIIASNVLRANTIYKVTPYSKFSSFILYNVTILP